jgi:hypothetical protein
MSLGPVALIVYTTWSPIVQGTFGSSQGLQLLFEKEYAIGEEDDGRWVSGRNHVLRRAAHFSSSYVDMLMCVDWEKDLWQGAPIGMVAMSLPPTVLFSAAQSAGVGHELSPGIDRHPLEVLLSCIG